MARRNKEHIIFDDDATVIIQKDSEVKTDEEEMSTAHVARQADNDKPVQVVDVLDAIAGFVMPTFDMIRDTDGNGECVLCGKQTAYKMRKLCVDCMHQHGREFYEKARTAIKNGETTIQ